MVGEVLNNANIRNFFVEKDMKSGQIQSAGEITLSSVKDLVNYCKTNNPVYISDGKQIYQVKISTDGQNSVDISPLNERTGIDKEENVSGPQIKPASASASGAIVKGEEGNQMLYVNLDSITLYDNGGSKTYQTPDKYTDLKTLNNPDSKRMWTTVSDDVMFKKIQELLGSKWDNAVKATGGDPEKLKEMIRNFSIRNYNSLENRDNQFKKYYGENVDLIRGIRDFDETTTNAITNRNELSLGNRPQYNVPLLPDGSIDIEKLTLSLGGPVLAATGNPPEFHAGGPPVVGLERTIRKPLSEGGSNQRQGCYKLNQLIAKNPALYEPLFKKMFGDKYEQYLDHDIQSITTGYDTSFTDGQGFFVAIEMFENPTSISDQTVTFILRGDDAKKFLESHAFTDKFTETPGKIDPKLYTEDPVQNAKLQNSYMAEIYKNEANQAFQNMADKLTGNIYHHLLTDNPADGPDKLNQALEKDLKSFQLILDRVKKFNPELLEDVEKQLLARISNYKAQHGDRMTKDFDLPVIKAYEDLINNYK